MLGLPQKVWGGELSARNILRKEMHGTKFNHGSPLIIFLDENMVASVATMLLPEENKGQSAFLLSNILWKTSWGLGAEMFLHKLFTCVESLYNILVHAQFV